MPLPKFLDVLGDIYHANSGLDNFVNDNLSAMEIESKFAGSTDEFYEMDGSTQSHVLVIGSEWNWMLSDFNKSSERPSFFFVQISQDPPLGGRKLNIRKKNEDGPLFQKHVRAWLREEPNLPRR